MRGLTLYLTSCLAAAAVTCLPWASESLCDPHAFPGWPSAYDDQELHAMPLSPREKQFAKHFPGKIAKFSVGSRIMIIRWVTRPTRKLHPAAHCFKASGYRVHPQAILKDRSGTLWSSFRCTRGDEDLNVREQICDAAGGSWTDVSSWYWAAVLKQTDGPWWAVTIIREGSANAD
jgi:hypothetical protein